MAVGRATSSSRITGSASQWKTFGSMVRTSRPSDFPACPWVSKSTRRTFAPFFSARYAAVWTASVVLHVPPFSLMKAIRRNSVLALQSVDLGLDRGEDSLQVFDLVPEQ